MVGVVRVARHPRHLSSGPVPRGPGRRQRGDTWSLGTQRCPKPERRPPSSHPWLEPRALSRSSAARGTQPAPKPQALHVGDPGTRHADFPRAALPRTREPLEDESFFIRKCTQPAPAADVRTQKQAFSGYDAASCPGFRSRRRMSAGKPVRARRRLLRRQRRDFTGDHGCARCEHEGKLGKVDPGVSLQLLRESRTIPTLLIKKKPSRIKQTNKQINDVLCLNISHFSVHLLACQAGSSSSQRDQGSAGRSGTGHALPP